MAIEKSPSQSSKHSVILILGILEAQTPFYFGEGNGVLTYHMHSFFLQGKTPDKIPLGSIYEGKYSARDGDVLHNMGRDATE